MVKILSKFLKTAVTTFAATVFLVSCSSEAPPQAENTVETTVNTIVEATVESQAESQSSPDQI